MNFQLTHISEHAKNSLQENYDLKRKESYFNLNQRKIILRTPVSNNKFVVKGIFYLTKGEPLLIVHITDMTEVARKEHPSKFFLDINIDFDDVIVVDSNEFYLHPDDHLSVIIFNDDTIINKVNILEETQISRGFNYLSSNSPSNGLIIKEVKTLVNINAFGNGGYFEPKESGGGVIITGP